MRATKRLAINIALMYSHDADIHEFLWEQVQTPERLAVVIPGKTPYARTCRDPRGFVPPGKRRWLVTVRDTAHDSVVVRVLDERRKTGAMSLGTAILCAHKELSHWRDGIPREQAMLDRRVTVTQTVVEYQ